MRALSLTLALAIALAGCLEGADKPAPPSPAATTSTPATPTVTTPASEKLALRSLSEGSSSGLPETRRLITVENEWRALWAEHSSLQSPAPPRPGVDFPNESVIAVVLAEKGSGCYAVRVTNASFESASRKLNVDVTSYTPPPDAVCPAVMTQPYHFVAVPGRDGATAAFTEQSAGAYPPEPGSSGASRGELRTLAEGTQSGVHERTMSVHATRESWAAFWANHTAATLPPPDLPEVDFETERVFVAVLGDKPNGCYAVEVTKIDGETSTNAHVTTHTPPKDMMCIQVITQPFHFVAFPKELHRGPVFVIESVKEGPPA